MEYSHQVQNRTDTKNGKNDSNPFEINEVVWSSRADRHLDSND